MGAAFVRSLSDDLQQQRIRQMTSYVWTRGLRGHKRPPMFPHGIVRKGGGLVLEFRILRHTVPEISFFWGETANRIRTCNKCGKYFSAKKSAQRRCDECGLWAGDLPARYRASWLKLRVRLDQQVKRGRIFAETRRDWLVEAKGDVLLRKMPLGEWEKKWNGLTIRRKGRPARTRLQANLSA